MSAIFLYGTLCHAPLLSVVLGRAVVMRPAMLVDHAVYWAKDQSFPLIKPLMGGMALGVVVEGLSAEDVARLDFFEGGFGYQTRAVTLDGGQVVQAYFPTTDRWKTGAVWSLSDWEQRWGAIAVATAGDFMALYGQRPSAEVQARYHAMLVRGASRVRAANGNPTVRRKTAAADDIAVSARSLGYSSFFAVEDYQLAYRRFDGSLSRVVDRAVFISGDAVTVLPYDPVRDRVLLIEQFRMGPMARGDGQPWSLEAIAGRIDPGETPEEAGRREAVEEAGLALGALLPVSSYYPSPGAKSEYLYSYVALADLPDGVEGVFGLAEEAEDIRGHLLSFDDFMALVDSGEVNNAPLVLTAFWLARERARLRAGN